MRDTQSAENSVAKNISGKLAYSDRVASIKTKGDFQNLAITQEYAPTTAAYEETIDSFYGSLNEVKHECKRIDCTIIMGI